MLAGPFLLCLTASITVGHATDRERVQVAFQRSKGRSGIQGRHRSDSDASHSAPSARQDGAYDLTKQRKTMSDNLDRIDARIGGEA